MTKKEKLALKLHTYWLELLTANSTNNAADQYFTISNWCRLHLNYGPSSPANCTLYVTYDYVAGPDWHSTIWWRSFSMTNQFSAQVKVAHKSVSPTSSNKETAAALRSIVRNALHLLQFRAFKSIELSCSKAHWLKLNLSRILCLSMPPWGVTRASRAIVARLECNYKKL